MKLHSNKGFSLMETMVIIALVSTAGLALQNSLASFYQKNAYIFESASSIDIAQRGLKTSITNLRESSYGADGSYPLEAIATSSVTFYADTDGNGVVEKIRIYSAAGSFYRTNTKPAGNPPSYTGQTPATSTIAAYLRNATSTPIFRYYNASGVEIPATSSPQSVSSIAVRIDIDLNPNRAPAISTMTGTATLRNLRVQ